MVKIDQNRLGGGIREALSVNSNQIVISSYAFFFIEWECTEILPGYLGCDFQYTLALEKKNTQPQVGMKWKMRPPQRFALVAVFSKTSLLSAVYYYIINKQSFHPGTPRVFACYWGEIIFVECDFKLCNKITHSCCLKDQNQNCQNHHHRHLGAKIYVNKANPLTSTICSKVRGKEQPKSSRMGGQYWNMVDPQWKCQKWFGSGDNKNMKKIRLCW